MRADKGIPILKFMEKIINVRDYESTLIEESVINDLFQAFSLGPSLNNLQPWEVVVLETEAEKEKAASATLDPFLTKESHGAQVWITSAPLAALVCTEKRRVLARLGEEGEIFAIGDLFAAVQNFRIAASFHGLSSAVVREFDKNTMKQNFNLPWYIDPVCIITAGYSNAIPEFPPTFKLSDFLHRGRFE